MMSVEERFQAKVNKTESCWEWLATTNGTGYGLMRVGDKYQLAHRISYKLFKGEIPPGQVVRHTCDNSLCVNPDHLILGSQSENVRDMMQRGRCGRHVLSLEQVTEIRAILSQGNRSHKVIGCQFGVSRQTIGRIADELTYTS